MNHSHSSHRIGLLVILGLGMMCSTANTSTGQAVSGRPVSSMTIFDTTMTDFMGDNDIEAAVLGVDLPALGEALGEIDAEGLLAPCLLYTSPSPRD